MKTPQELLWNYSLRALGRRAHTTHELKKKLQEHSAYEPEASTVVIQKLTDLNYLNDHDFVARTIEQYSKLKPTGLRGLQARLAKKGIPSDLVKELFQASEVSEFDLARAALKKYAHKWVRLSELDRRKKQIYFLASRGFPSSVCFQVAKLQNSGYDMANNSLN